MSLATTTVESTRPRSCVEVQANAIALQLRAKRNPARALLAQRYLKRPVAVLGIDAATLRRFAREQAERLMLEGGSPNIVPLCERLLDEPELEVRATGLLILGALVDELEPGLLDRAAKWIETRLDNWALVDAFCSCVASPLFVRDASVERVVRRWSRAPNLWIRRAALVTIVPLARHGQSLDVAFELAREHLDDREEIIHKATGWLLREAGKTNPERLIRFLLEQGPRTPRVALRAAIERLPTSERHRILQETRNPRLSTQNP